MAVATSRARTALLLSFGILALTTGSAYANPELRVTKQGSASDLNSLTVSSTNTSKPTFSVTIFVYNSAGDGEQVLNYAISTDRPWLLVNPSGGAAPQAVSLTIARSGLTAGTNNGTVTVTSNGGTKKINVIASCSNAISGAAKCGAGTIPNPPPPPPVSPKPPTSGGGGSTSNPKPTPGVNNAKTDPLRPNYQDISIKIGEGDKELMWFRGRNTTQTQKDAMEETKTGVAMPEVIRYARSIPACADEARNAVNALSTITARLGPNYEGRALLPHRGDPREGSGEWMIKNDGNHYSIETNTFQRIQSCSISNAGATQCAQSPLMNQGLLDLLDMRIESGRCVKGATFTVQAPLEAYDPIRGKLAPIRSKKKMPEIIDSSNTSVDQLGLLKKTHGLHFQVSQYRCGLGPVPPAGVVPAAHIAFEKSATNETQHHFFRMKDFSGFEDPRWSKRDICEWARIQDDAHHRWMGFIMQGKWGHAREADNDHQLSHICMGLRDDNLKVVYSCTDSKGNPQKIDNCPKKTCQQVLDEHPDPEYHPH